MLAAEHVSGAENGAEERSGPDDRMSESGAWKNTVERELERDSLAEQEGSGDWGYLLTYEKRCERK